jgi:predicted phage terminase large subunit-like protein
MAKRKRKPIEPQASHITCECETCGAAFQQAVRGLRATECPTCRIKKIEKGGTVPEHHSNILQPVHHTGRTLKQLETVTPAPEKKIDVVERELVARELARRKLIAFVLRNKPDYLAGWFHKDLAQRLEKFLEDVRQKKSPRLLLQVPARHGKSLLASQFFPAWALGRNPDMEIIACSYAVSLATAFSRRVRELIRDKDYKNLFERTNLDPEEQGAESWRTTKGGGYVAAGVGGPITGKGAHILILDDLVKNYEEAESLLVRESHKSWYQTTAYTRLAPGGGVLAIGTRWHFDDILGWLESQSISGEGDTFEVVRYPMVAVEDEVYRRQGEVLHPERYDLEAAERIKRAVGPRAWSALYQQNPQLDEGAYFSRDMFHYYDGEPPRRLTKYAAFDLAVSKSDRADYSVGIVVGVDAQERIYVLDLVRGRWDAHRTVEEILQVHKVHKPELLGIEKGVIQLALGPYLEKRISEERVFDINIQPLPTGRRDKEARARSIQGRMRQGMVFWPREASWLEALQQEFLRFPNGAHDDMCFVAGTRVSTPGGLRPIEGLKVGDEVLTPFGARRVLRAGQTGVKPVWRLVTERGRVLEGSANHPVFTASRSFVRMDGLQPGDRLQSIGDIDYVQSVTETGRTEPVFNLTVEGDPVYFAEGVLVHNCDAAAHIGLLLQDLSSKPRAPSGERRVSDWRDRLTGLVGGRPRKTPMSA